MNLKSPWLKGGNVLESSLTVQWSDLELGLGTLLLQSLQFLKVWRKWIRIRCQTLYTIHTVRLRLQVWCGHIAHLPPWDASYKARAGVSELQCQRLCQTFNTHTNKEQKHINYETNVLLYIFCDFVSNVFECPSSDKCPKKTMYWKSLEK